MSTHRDIREPRRGPLVTAEAVALARARARALRAEAASAQFAAIGRAFRAFVAPLLRRPC